jgi:adenylate cyclase
MPSVRRLAAILAADVAGYSRLMGADEESAIFLHVAIRHHYQSPFISRNFYGSTVLHHSP